MIKKLLFVVMLVLSVHLMGLSSEEYQQRRIKLNQLASQIKQETGFIGQITVEPKMNRISQLEGSFPDIKFSTEIDTVQARQSFDRIVEKILHYLPVTRDQLSRGRIDTSPSRIVGVSYNQTANGYEIEGGSRLRLSYRYEREAVLIVNDLAYLDPSELPTKPVITEEEAIQIFLENVHIPEYLKHQDIFAPRIGRLMYCYIRNGETSSKREYRLSWRVANINRNLIIDALTGEIIAIHASPPEQQFNREQTHEVNSD